MPYHKPFPYPGAMPPHPPHHCHDFKPCFDDRVDIVGKLTLSIKCTNHCGHVSYLNIIPGKTYLIEARSKIKGKCTFIGKIIDFDSYNGTESILEPPHEIDINSIVVDCSDDYDAKIIRINVKNLINIVPVDSIDNQTCMDFENYFIEDPFSQKKLDDNTKEDEKKTDI